MFPIFSQKVLSIITLYFGIGVVSMIETWCSYGIGVVSTSYYPHIVQPCLGPKLSSLGLSLEAENWSR